MEKHTVARLGRSASGIGYDEGGHAEAVRRKPYSVILDEIEKLIDVSTFSTDT